MRFEFVSDDKEINRSELCVDYGKPWEKNLALCFLSKFLPKMYFF